MLKVKKGISYDLKVLSLQEGTGKYKGMAGALVCQFRDDKTITVGTGLTDDQRKRWWSEFFITRSWEKSYKLTLWLRVPKVS